MQFHHRHSWIWLLLLWAQPVLAFTGISISVDPDTIVVQPEQLFEVVVRVDSIGALCAGFENTVTWDGERVEYLGYEPDSLMNELSWSEWHAPNDTLCNRSYPDSTHLCIMIFNFQGFLDSPGPLYSLNFRARTLGESPVHFAMARFGNIYGGPIQPVLPHDGRIIIADPGSGTPSPVPETVGWRLRVRPNPLTEASWIEARLPEGIEARLELFDVTGRLEAQTDLARHRRGASSGEVLYGLSWGDLLPGETHGVHLVRLSAGRQTCSTVVVGP